MVDCEIATVTVALQSGEGFQITVPSYTRTPASFTHTVLGLVESYLERTEEERQQASVADFAFFLLSEAMLEPYQQEELG